MKDGRRASAQFERLVKTAKGGAPVTGPMAALARDVRVAVASVLRKGEIEAVFDVKVKGKRVVVNLAGVADEVSYKVSSQIMGEIVALKAAHFREGRYGVHHTIFVNERRLAYSA